MDCNCNDPNNATASYNVPLATYEQGWEDAVKKLQDVLKVWGEAACILLDFMPSKELTLPWRVSEDCVLEFTVRKQ